MFWVIFAFVELFAIGLTLFVLFVANEGIKVSKRAETATYADQEIARMPRFFSRAQPLEGLSRRLAVDDLALLRFEQYLKEEQEMAEEFVASPSIASLYKNSERSLTLN